MFTYDLVRKELLAENISRIFLKPSHAALKYEAGQYIHVLHDNHTFSPISIASLPKPSGEFEIHLFHPQNNLSAQNILRMLTENKKLRIEAPFGHCCFSKLNLSKPIIFVMRDVGFAPVKAIMEQCIHDKTFFKETHFYWLGENYLKTLVESWVSAFPFIQYTEVVAQSVIEKMSQDYSDLSSYQLYAVDGKNAAQALLRTSREKGLMQENFYSDILKVSKGGRNT